MIPFYFIQLNSVEKKSIKISFKKNIKVNPINVVKCDKKQGKEF